MPLCDPIIQRNSCAPLNFRCGAIDLVVPQAVKTNKNKKTALILNIDFVVNKFPIIDKYPSLKN